MRTRYTIIVAIAGLECPRGPLHPAISRRPYKYEFVEYSIFLVVISARLFIPFLGGIAVNHTRGLRNPLLTCPCICEVVFSHRREEGLFENSIILGLRLGDAYNNS